MTFSAIIKLLKEIRPMIINGQQRALLDQAILELRLAPDPSLQNRQPAPSGSISSVKLEAAVLHLENRLKSRYPELTPKFWMDVKKELPILLSIEK